MISTCQPSSFCFRGLSITGVVGEDEAVAVADRLRNCLEESDLECECEEEVRSGVAGVLGVSSSFDSFNAAARESICLEGRLSTFINSSSESTSGVLGVSLNVRRFRGRGALSILASKRGLGRSGAIVGRCVSAVLVVMMGIEEVEAGLAGRL